MSEPLTNTEKQWRYDLKSTPDYANAPHWWHIANGMRDLLDAARATVAELRELVDPAIEQAETWERIAEDRIADLEKERAKVAALEAEVRDHAEWARKSVDGPEGEMYKKYVAERALSDARRVALLDFIEDRADSSGFVVRHIARCFKHGHLARLTETPTS